MESTKYNIQQALEMLKEEEASLNFDLRHKHLSGMVYITKLHQLDMVQRDSTELEIALKTITKYE